MLKLSLVVAGGRLFCLVLAYVCADAQFRVEAYTGLLDENILSSLMGLTSLISRR